MQRARIFLWMMVLAAISAACAAPAVVTPAPAISLRVAGSTSMEPLLRALADAYSQEHPDVVVDVQDGNSAYGMTALLREEADIAAVSWREEDAADDSEWQWIPLAVDAVAVIVHPHNSLEGLTLEQAARLFAGWYIDWDELGGRGGDIQVLTRENGSGSRRALEERLLGNLSLTQTALVMPSSEAVREWVAGHANAVGYLSLLWVDESVRAVPLDGEAPLTDAGAPNASYPLTRTLYLVSEKSPSRGARDFLRFCTSPAGQEILLAHKALPIPK